MWIEIRYEMSSSKMDRINSDLPYPGTYSTSGTAYFGDGTVLLNSSDIDSIHSIENNKYKLITKGLGSYTLSSASYLKLIEDLKNA